MNRWNIPVWLEKEVVERDRHCVYCRTSFGSGIGKGSLASWEHIINDSNIVTHQNIARCCVACNSSKGTKRLSDWLQSSYCKKRGINEATVAEVVKNALRAALKDGA